MSHVIQNWISNFLTLDFYSVFALVTIHNYVRMVSKVYSGYYCTL